MVVISGGPAWRPATEATLIIFPERLGIMLRRPTSWVRKNIALMFRSISVYHASAASYPAEAWKKVMDMNINAMFFLTQDVGRRSMIPKRSGKIINVASVAGLHAGPPEMTTIAYNTSKAAAISFT